MNRWALVATTERDDTTTGLTYKLVAVYESAGDAYSAYTSETDDVANVQEGEHSRFILPLVAAYQLIATEQE